LTHATVMLRPVGNPLPLGFLALAAGTVLVSGLQLSFIEPSEGKKVALILLAFVAPLQRWCPRPRARPARSSRRSCS
jgi:uncharacterized protein